jgi:tetraether lipid synthase
VRGINFQPAFHAGRHMQHDPLQRMTIPDVLKLIEQQTAGKFMVSDFIPVPCCFPTCNSVSIPESFTIGDIAKNVLMIMLQDFMDPWTFNQKNVMKCCKEFLLPSRCWLLREQHQRAE